MSLDKGCIFKTLLQNTHTTVKLTKEESLLLGIRRLRRWHITEPSGGVVRLDGSEHRVLLGRLGSGEVLLQGGGLDRWMVRGRWTVGTWGEKVGVVTVKPTIIHFNILSFSLRLKNFNYIYTMAYTIFKLSCVQPKSEPLKHNMYKWACIFFFKPAYLKKC